VLEAAAKRRRRSIRLHEDGKWLRQLTRNPARLLGEMANRQLLYRVGAGRYVIAPRGTVSLEQAAPAELLVDILLGGRTSYYVGFLSALISHRLTDLHSNDIYAAVLASGPVKRPPRLPGRELHLAYLNEKRWPGTEAGEIERVRAFGEAKEFWWRSSAERTLVDSLTRPEMSGGIETTISCWSRAHLDDRVDWSEVARIAKRLGPSAERRTAFVMTRLEIEGARRWFAGLDGRSSNVLLDRSQGFALHGRASRDSSTGVVVNVPDDRLSGWMAGAGLG
jgi:predicted transcriptional regulator of viral defense system